MEDLATGGSPDQLQCSIQCFGSSQRAGRLSEVNGTEEVAVLESAMDAGREACPET